MTNQELAQALKDLHAYLVIAGYDPTHAARYPKIAAAIEKLPEPVEQMRREGRLQEIPQVGKLIQTYIKELLDTGTCSKIKDFEHETPYSVVELTRVKGIGPLKAKVLFDMAKIKNLKELKEAEAVGSLVGIPGVTAAILKAIQQM